MMDTSPEGGGETALDTSGAVHERNETFAIVSNTTFANPFSVLFYRSIFIVIYSVIFVVCIIGNVLVLFVTTKSAHMKTRTYFFLANLAVADLCVGILCVLPNLLMFLYPGWLLGQAMCKIYFFAESFSFCASVMLLAVIAMERYIAVLHPLQAKGLFTKCRMHAMQTTIWVIAAAYNSPLLVIFDTVSVPSGEGSGESKFCFINMVIDMRLYYTINFVLWYALPLLIMLFVYIVIAWTLWNSGSIFTSSNTDSNSSGSGSRLVQTNREDRSGGTSSSSGSSCAYSADGRSMQGKLNRNNSTKESKVSLCCTPAGNKSSGCQSDEMSHSHDGNGSNALNPFESMESGLVGSQSHAGPKTVYKNRNRILMCWSWASTYDSPKLDHSPLTRSNRSPRSNNAHPSNYFELACINAHNSNPQRQQKLRHNVFLNQSGRRNTNCTRQTIINGEMPSDTYTATPPSTCESKPRYMTTSLRVLASRRKVVRMLVVLLVAFAVCVLPHHVRLLMHYWDVYPQSTFAIGFFPPLAFICLYLNSALNPVLYSLFSESFRRSLRECARKPCQRWRSCLTKSDFRDSVRN